MSNTGPGIATIRNVSSTVESLRQTIVQRGLMSESDLTAALAQCRAHLRNPDVVFTSYLVAQVWGRVG